MVFSMRVLGILEGFTLMVERFRDREDRQNRFIHLRHLLIQVELYSSIKTTSLLDFISLIRTNPFLRSLFHGEILVRDAIQQCSLL